MRIGYACLTLGVLNTNFKSCIQRNANEKNLLALISHNLNSLENIIDYNIKNNILLFRISSDIIPFGSSPINPLEWSNIFADQLAIIGKKILSSKMRVSMHPGQYTVLNSPTSEVVSRAILDLKYHSQFLESLGVDGEHKIILHIGGVYKDKAAAIKTFKTNYAYLDMKIKKRLVIENDDKSYNINDVLHIGHSLGIPVVFDNLHNEINPYNNDTEGNWINLCKETWKYNDGPQKIHYSQQAIDKKPGAHSETIEVNRFLDFCKKLSSTDIDIMLEVKDKNVSAVKCINRINKEPISTDMLPL
jgi:UV DNA damage endonuclease